MEFPKTGHNFLLGPEVIQGGIRNDNVEGTVIEGKASHVCNE
jgi:hypothetical protein